MKPWLRVALVAALCLASWASIVFIFWPGMMSSDSVDQLGQARSGAYNGWHPPVMAWVWHFADAVVPGPGGMLALQQLVLWLALGVLAVLALARSRAGWLVLGIGWWPPVLSMGVVIWKDVEMALALALAVALLALARDLRRWPFALAALGPLWFATAIRHNAITGTAPLMVVAVMAFVGLCWPRVTRAGTVVLCALVVVGVTWSAGRFTKALVGERTMPPMQANFVHDLTGLSARTGEWLLPPEFTAFSRLGEAELRPLYRPDSSDPLYFEPGRVGMTRDDAIVRALRRAWVKAVVAHPVAWLRLRWGMTARLTGVSKPIAMPVYDAIDPNPFGVSLPPGPARVALFSGLHGMSGWLPFRHFLYLGLAAALGLFLAVARRADALSVGVLLSVWGYFAPLPFVSPAPDFRYLFWCLLGTLLLLAVARRRPGAASA